MVEMKGSHSIRILKRALKKTYQSKTVTSKILGGADYQVTQKKRYILSSLSSHAQSIFTEDVGTLWGRRHWDVVF